MKFKFCVQLVTTVISLTLAQAGFAQGEDSCEKQRLLFPQKWNDTSQEKTLYFCSNARGTAFTLKLGQSVKKNSGYILSLVHQEGSRESGYHDSTRDEDVFRIGITQRELDNLTKSGIASTLLRSERACIRDNDFSETVILRMDSGTPNRDEETFIAPRTTYQFESVNCKVVQARPT